MRGVPENGTQVSEMLCKTGPCAPHPIINAQNKLFSSPSQIPEVKIGSSAGRMEENIRNLNFGRYEPL